MLNVLVAIKVWCEQLSNNIVVIHCDNLAVVHILQSGRGCDSYSLSVARNIWLYTAKYDIDLNIVYIPGYRNVIADLLSCWHKSKNRALLHHLVPNHRWVTISSTMHTLDHDI